MAQYAYPTTAYNNRAVTPREYEDLMHPMAPDGLIGTPDLSDLVYADSSLLGVKIRATRAALIRGYRWESGETELTQTVDANTTSGTTRRDLIVLRLTRNPWTVAIAVIKGTPAASPTTPSPTYGTNTATGVWELPLAVVTVPFNTATVGAGQCVQIAWYVGEDGQMVSPTSSTLPPGNPGRRVYENSTGVIRVHNGTAWRKYAIDLETCPGTITADGTTLANITSTTFVPGSPVVGRAFVAPPSGGIWVTVGGSIAQSVAGSNTRLSWEVRQGGTVGAGTVIWSPSSVRGISCGQAVVSGGPSQLSASDRDLADTLIPGTTYNIRTMHTVTSGTGGVTYRKLMVEPVL
ncbi:hypothetical protein GCM10011608_10000 [Micromonospora sonchi]|uniref:Uncharacterized protein n=1 Tax=Micromonospora sonchi TaxID=1763543 RepID=A0A917WSA3_9ACTN|nr:hypothetical protein [Micromonospora sonchi]GGM27236.1 hypothetical protein GCM10011608_10000 [Micromonospora sonchi]